MERMAMAFERIADALEGNLGPVGKLAHQADEALSCSRGFIKKWGPWTLPIMTTGGLIVLGVSPKLTDLVGNFLELLQHVVH